MKTLYKLTQKALSSFALFFCLSLMSFNLYGQITNIPDPNFEQALIDLGIDSDGTVNGQVLTSDIENVTTLNVVNKGIFDLTGIEGFASLESFDVTQNPLTAIDLSNNIQLKELYCSNWGGFFILDIRSLNLSHNINLELLYAENLFLLEELNVKNGNNAMLTVELSCEFEGDPCELTELNCVTVDDEEAATNNEPPYDTWYIAAVFNYSEDCTLGISSQEDTLFSIYPNPAQNELFITSKNTLGNLSLKIFNIEGKLLSTQTLEVVKQTSIDVSQLKSGIYFLNIEDENGNITIKKFIKE